MADGRDIAEWKWSHWAGDVGQLHQAATLALPKLHVLAPFPEPYDAEHPWDQSREKRPINPRYEHYLAAVAARKVEVVVEERDGYTHYSDGLDYLLQVSAHAMGEIERIVISMGKGILPPGVEIRVSGAGLAVKIVGFDRTWTAGLRHELAKVLKPPWRLHAPLMATTDGLYAAVPSAFFLTFLGLDVILREGSAWSFTARLLVSLAAGLLLGLAIAAVGWASAGTFELVTSGELPRYQRWRKRVFAGVGAVAVGIVASALYGVLF